MFTLSFANSHFTINDTAIIKNSQPVAVCKKSVLTNFVIFTTKHKCWSLLFNEVAVLQRLTLTNMRVWHRYILTNFAKFFVITFLENPFGRLLLYNHSFFVLPHHDVLSFQKRCHTYFPAGYFLSLISSLGVRVSSIFQPLISHLRGKIRNVWKQKF